MSNKYSCPIVFGPNAKTDYDSKILNNNDIIYLGNIKIEVIHTPGHTLESVCYLLYDEYNKQHSLFTGDTLFVGDVGIPDVAQRYENITKDELASNLYDSLNKIMTLDDNVILYPGHGKGTQCGKNLSSETSSTIGKQKKLNYALKFNNKTEFIKSICSNIPDSPGYFIEAVKKNIKGSINIDTILKDSLNSLSHNKLIKYIMEGINVIDTRSMVDFSTKHLTGSINIPLNGKYAITAANILNVKEKIVIICADKMEEESIIRLLRVGFEKIIGYYNNSLNIDYFNDYSNVLKSKPGSDLHNISDFKSLIKNILYTNSSMNTFRIFAIFHIYFTVRIL